MSRLIKSRNYLMKCLGFVLLFGFISLGAIGGCSNNSGGQDGTRALTENDFANDTTLRANPEKHLVVKFLEHPDSDKPENDTGEVGNDVIPLTYTRTLEHTYCWEDDDGEAGHFMELDDSEGNEILRLDVNGECVTEVIEAGNYVMTLHHDGRTTQTVDTRITDAATQSIAIFMIANPDNILLEVKETDGLINRFKVAAANILKGIQDTVSKDARAQSVKKNINTLITTNSCEGCNLESANLRNADLSFADLRSATLSDADLSVADLFGADLSVADLIGADLSGANLIGADLSVADLSFATLIGANLNFATLIGADLSDALLIGANLSVADLSGAWLIGADLSFADLPGATWCDGNCICGPYSFGSCDGCASQDTCT